MRPDLTPYADKLHAELLRKSWRKPVPHERTLIERFVGSLFFQPSVIRKIESGHHGSEWNTHGWVHQARRDRSGGKLRYLCTRKQAWTLLDDMCNLAYNLWEVGSLAGIPDNLNPYQNNESSIPPWKSVSDTPLVPPKQIAKKKRQPVYSGPQGGNMDKAVELLKSELAAVNKRAQALETSIKLLEGSAELREVSGKAADVKPHGRTWSEAARRKMSLAVKRAIAAKKKKKAVTARKSRPSQASKKEQPQSA